MRIDFARPPNYDAIVAAFPFAARPGVIFTYGDVIYNPAGVEISAALKAHESVHSQRQGALAGGPERWWQWYLTSADFRAEEEALAHRAEYRAFKSWEKDRNKVARELHAIAARLAGPLYGGVFTYQAARRVIA